MPDGFHNALEIRRHLLVGETQNLKAFGDKEGIAILVRLLSFLEIVRFTVKLND